MTTLTQVSETQADKTTTINEIAEALSMAGLFGIRRDATTGLTFGYYGGEIWVNGVLTTIANGTTLLAASSTNYVEATTAGVVSDNATGFTAGQIPLFTVTTNASGITAITDHRITNLPMWGNLVKSIAGGAGDTTLTAAEARADAIRLTGAITGNRTVTLPATPWAKVFYNDTSGAFTVTVKTSSVGSPIPATFAITQGKTAVLWSDGEHVHSATTDTAAFGLGTMATQNANNVAITGGAIDGTPIGVTTRGAVNATTLNANGAVTLGDNAADTLLVTTNAMVVTAAGEVTMPLQPAFAAYLSAAVNNVTGTSTAYQLVPDTEIFDLGSDYNATTGVFTAPIAGRYRFSAKATFTDLSSATTYVVISLISSNRTWRHEDAITPNASALQASRSISALVDMDAGDTIFVSVRVYGMAGDTADISGSGTADTFFTGELVC